MKPYLNPALSPCERAEDLLKDLTLDEKMAQVNCYMFAREEDLENRHKCLTHGIGVISTLEFRGVPKKDCIARRNDIQKEVIERSPHHIPAIFHMEGLCGLLFSDASCFPSGMARGASFDCELKYAIGKTVGDEAAQMGISHVFAPVLDVTRDPRFGRSYESYGEDETLVTRMGVSYALGVQASEGRPLNVEGVAKHFLGFHRGAGGEHGSDCTIGERELREVYAKPFEACFRLSDLKGVMPCYNILNGELVSLSARYETKLLREELGFQGVAVSDYCAVMNSVTCNHVAASPVEAGLRAMKAGMDVEQQFPYGFGEDLKAKFLSGEADIAILDRAVLRVLEAKFRMGLFEHPYIDEKDIVPVKDDALSRRSALEGMVLLKNDGILPLKPVKKIAVIGYHASTARGYFGGYTNFSMYEGALGDKNTMAGLVAEGGADPTYPGSTVYREDAYRDVYEAALHQAFPAIRTLPEALKARFPESEITFAYGYDFAGTDESGFEEALKAIEGADVAILTLGGKCGTGARCSMGENVNSTSIGLPPAQEQFIRRASALKKPLIGVHFDGRPISSDAADECLNAILECWNPSQFGSEAAVALLAGDETPSGRLPVTVARNAGQLPLYYSQPFGSGYRPNEFYKDSVYIDSSTRPRYYFGHGLSYTSFEYSDLALDKTTLSAEDTLTLSFTLKNTGKREGTEVVQLYLCDPVASVARPAKQLLGFARVPLKVGEERRVTFSVPVTLFAFLDEDMKWKVEKGEVQLLVGASSEDIRLTASLSVKEDAYIDPSTRAFFAEVK